MRDVFQVLRSGGVLSFSVILYLMSTTVWANDQASLKEMRDASRRWVIENSEQKLLTPILNNDRVENLLDMDSSDVIRDPRFMDSQRLLSGSIPEVPWSDSYWPMYKGLVAHRYADRSFPDSASWEANYNFFLNHPPSQYIGAGPDGINALSPAEKYDLLVGDSNWGLTQNSWGEGKGYFDRVGRVATWMGICHGWAAAAHTFQPVPSQVVTAMAADGIHEIQFYPSDIKALNSVLWAHASPRTRFIGGRCRAETPPQNPDGRVTDPNCYDTNPGTFHMAMVNRIAIEQKSFVMDGYSGYEVWNFPIHSYNYQYFNPVTRQRVVTLNEAMIARDRFTADPYRNYRTPDAKYIVGIIMNVKHTLGTAPSHGAGGAPLGRKQYTYDIELDANYNIIGGEWYESEHPDFLWTYAPNAQAMSAGDSMIQNPDWDLNSPLPRSWLNPAVRASSYGQPLTAVVKALSILAPRP